MEISMVGVATILVFILRYSEASHPTDQFDYIADVGKRIALTCRTSIDKPVDFSFQSHQDAEVKEIVNSGEIFNGLKVRYAIEHSGPNEYQLIIFRASLNDTGIYRCTENSGNGEMHEILLRVTESGSETKPVTETLLADVGSSVSLPCRSRRTEGVDWSFVSSSTGNQLHICQNGRFIDGLSAKYGMSTYVKGDYSLVVPAVSSSDAGTYTCTEDAGAGQRHIVKLIVVNTADRIDSQVAATGSTVTFVCRLNNPRELIRWSFYKRGSKERIVVFNGRNVVGNSVRLSVHNHVSRSATSVLLINNVEDGDAGKFVCHTSSTSINQIFELSVQGINESPSSPETRHWVWIVSICIVLFTSIIGNCSQITQVVSMLHESQQEGNCSQITQVVSLLHESQQEGDRFNWELTQVRHLFEEWVNKTVEHINIIETKPDAIVGVHGCDSAGSVLASVVSDRLKLPLVLMRKHHVDVGKNDTHFHSRYNQEMGMRVELVELRTELAEQIRNVVIVDTEIVTGRSLQAAIKELEAHNLHVIESMVLSDVHTQE